MFKLIIFILFYSIIGYSQTIDNIPFKFSSPVGNYQKINITYPKNVTIEFTSDKIIIKSKDLLDIEYNIISKSIEHNFEIYQLNHNTKILHARNFPTYNNGYIELVFVNEITKKTDTVNFIYNKNK